MALSQAVAHFYRQARKHQMACWNDGGSLSTYGARTERSYGSAPYGFHAVSAFTSAKRSVAFRADLAVSIKRSNKASASARKGWKTRHANAR